MVTIDQVKQLESRVSKTIAYVTKVNEENNLLKGKLDTYQRRIDELEVLIQRFKDDQNRIEEGIISALDSLNQFEDDVGKAIVPEKKPKLPPSEVHQPEPQGIEQASVPAEPEEQQASTSELDIF
ncbi:MAG: cell division protein ZapB [Spirochaetaceae bacterium]|jgi:chromosome segregation ATPase|nr:cell division protein ZapB [Spirochaetaceae bacterium]